MNSQFVVPEQAVRKPQGRRCRGFTLIELLVVVPIIVVLIPLLAPVLQKERCGARLTEVSHNVKVIINDGVRGYSASSDPHCLPKQINLLSEHLQHYQDLVRQLKVTSQTDPERVISTFTDGIADYTYIYPPMARESTLGWPPDPLPDCLTPAQVSVGIGTYHALILVAVDMEFGYLVLGFLDGHTEILNEDCEATLEEQRAALIELGYETIADLLFANEVSPEPIPPLLIKQSLSDPETVTTAVQTIDLVPDGKYRADDLYALARIDGGTQPATAFSDVGEDVLPGIILQILGEFARGAIEITGIPEDDPTEVDLETVLLALLGELPPGEEPPFEENPFDDALSFERLCQLTRLYVTDAGVADSLCAQLSAAAAAYDEGRPEAVNNTLFAYRQHLEAVADKKISLRHANMLRVLSTTLEAP